MGGRKETDILQEIRLEASKLGLTLFRNNVGALKDENGRLVKYGLHVGSPDLIGWDSKGRFVGIEVKNETGKVKPEQQIFLDAINKSGGIGIVCRDAKKLKELLTVSP